MFLLFEQQKQTQILKLLGAFDSLEIANKIIIKKEDFDYIYAEFEKNKIKIDDYKYIVLI